MLQLALRQRARGGEVRLACPEPPPGASRSLADEARRAGLAPALELERARGVRPWRDRGDVARLRALLEEGAVEIAHVWHTRDHVLALRAAGPRRRRGETRLVRTWRRAEPIPRDPASRWLLGPGTDGLLCVSPGIAQQSRALRAGRPVRGAFGAVDLARFAPAPPGPTAHADARAAVRAALGLPPAARVVGIVARVQPHRRFDLLLEAARRLFRADPEARLLVVGRGTRRRELAEEPARRLGIAERVVFAGYRGEDYAAVLRSLDVFTFLVPGSDGTCRALLEAAACGLPAVTSRRGALPEIVVDGETGLLVDEDPDALAAAWGALLADPARRRALGAAARRRAEVCFTPERLADEVEALYRECTAG
jgi:glycosyltransferase involved in cell wall biosynthesis